MKLIALFIFVLVVCTNAGEVEEDFLKPHRADVIGVSNQEILEDLEEEIHAIQKPKAVKATVIVAPVPVPTKKLVCPKFGPSLTKLLRSFGFSVEKLHKRCFSVAQARRFIRVQIARRERFRMRELLQREKEEKRDAIIRRARLRKEIAEKRKLAAKLREERRLRLLEERRRKHMEELKEEEERRRLAQEEARRRAAEAKAADYIPLKMKKLLKHFHYDYRKLEADRVPISKIQKELATDAAKEASTIISKYHQDVQQVSADVAGEFSKYMAAPLKEIRRVSQMEHDVVAESEKAKQEAHAFALRIKDTVIRRSNRLKAQLLQKEREIRQRAQREEKAAEDSIFKAEKELQENASNAILKESKMAQLKKEEAQRVINAANSWYQDQELPAIQRLSDLEQKKLAAKLNDIQTESKYSLLNLRHQIAQSS